MKMDTQLSKGQEVITHMSELEEILQQTEAQLALLFDELQSVQTIISAYRQGIVQAQLPADFPLPLPLTRQRAVAVEIDGERENS